MRTILLRPLLAIGFAATSASASAFTSPPRPIVECKVSGAEKLPAGVGGAAAICTAMNAAAAQSATNGVRVDVRVLGTSRLAATLSNSGGRVLAERRFATSDRALTRSAIDRFARSLMNAAAKMTDARTR